jgi:pimeloyl-ACP methyl ester carboxylesterase
VLIALHGYGGGHFRTEEWMWPIRETLDLGFDLVIMVLPYHGPRIESDRRYLPPRFPSRDVRFTIEALRQTHFDFAALHDWLRYEGAIRVGLAGVSLGAYCAALIATLDRQLSSLIHVTPLGCMATLSDRQRRFIGTQSEQNEQRDVFGRAFDPVNPLRRKPLINPDSVIVIAGEGDGITGLHHARLLADHFQCAQQTFPGGHIIRSGFRKSWIRALQAQLGRYLDR